MTALSNAAGMILRRMMPNAMRRRVRLIAMGWGRGFASIRRMSYASPALGLTGIPLDRYYIERFLELHASDIRGTVLEISEATYTRKFGGPRVTRSDVLHITPGAPDATIIADLATGKGLEGARFDCLIITQTLQMIFDTRAAVRTLYDALEVGGTLLITVPAIAPISRYDMERWGDFWRFNSLAARRLLETVAPPDCITIHTYGNLRAAVAFLIGLGPDDVGHALLDAKDEDFEMIIGVRVSKGSSIHVPQTGELA